MFYSAVLSLLLFVFSDDVVEGGGWPRNGRSEASSTVLRTHKLYAVHPPHDVSLYDVLQVPPCANVAQIARQYRKLSRELHPDKRGDTSSSNTDDDDELAKVREAYEVLKDDSTRLPYHRFGLLDASMAAAILTGFRTNGGRVPTAEQRRLLELMGCHSSHHRQQRHEQQQPRRVSYIAANLLEIIRPLVEGAISQQQFAHDLSMECHAIKYSPLGAQIIRCVGRAYRLSGRRVLRRHHHNNNTLLLPIHSLGLDLTEVLHETLRDAKQLITAALASGRLVVEDSARKTGRKKQTSPTITYDGLGDTPWEDDDFLDDEQPPPTEDDIRELERDKAQAAIVSALEIEALWKISKIELDRTIQKACQMILDGHYFFSPMQHHREKSGSTIQNKYDDGWVGSTGAVIELNVGRLRAAAAMVLVGDIMVQCSKQNTAWTR